MYYKLLYILIQLNSSFIRDILSGCKSSAYKLIVQVFCRINKEKNETKNKSYKMYDIFLSVWKILLIFEPY